MQLAPDLALDGELLPDRGEHFVKLAGLTKLDGLLLVPVAFREPPGFFGLGEL